MRILLVEDNARLSQAIKESLYKAGFEVDAIMNGEEALAAAQTQPYDALVLDLGLPDMDGLTVLETLRSRKNLAPVLILTARDKLTDKLAGLNGGADDYMIKPFEVDELIARIKVMIRRQSHAKGAVINLNNISFDTVSRDVQVSGERLSLSRRELDLLEQLVHAGNKVVTKKAIEQRIYSYGDMGSANSVEVLVHRLRKKLFEHAADVEIHTLKGIGYMMTGTDHAEKK